MASSRASFPALLIAALLAAVSVLLFNPDRTSAQVTHTGNFLLTPGQSQFAPFKVGPMENLVLTVCVNPDGDPVQVLADGVVVPTMGSIDDHGCRTRKVAASKITIGVASGSGSSSGTYTLSVSFP